ncbi:solute carrier organic anion transporter family member 74D-like [Oppia nitens]|uniref:solute carrier organic anion transporter family member 74D-like n=1 Tax=Oppia nitens TaxID=1686743 RepID=UPI0023DA3C93|nr:solute carrier organic anion transporter family member 74D-like [Oppia nitens]
MAIYSSVESLQPRACGVGSWRPKFLAKLATPKVFIAWYTIMGVVQGGPYSYVIASLTTLERRYAFSSLVMGIVLIADDVAGVIVRFPLGYFAHRFHRPRAIAIGQVLSGLGCWLAAVPYFIYGPGTHLLGASLATTTINGSAEYCNAGINGLDHCDQHRRLQNSPIIPVICLWFATFLIGAGSCFWHVVGVPLVDESVKKKNSPIYLSVISCGRLCGPAIATLLSSFVLRYYENPKIDTGIRDLKDPRWVGAWWIGFVCLGTALFITSVPMFLFPSDIADKKPTVDDNSVNKISRKTKPTVSQLDLKTRVMLLLKNPIYMCYLIGSMCQMFGFFGYSTFKGKYIESQYKKSASTANFISGMVGIIPSAIGIFLGGAFITFLKPGARLLTMFIFVIELLSTMGLFSGLFLGCPNTQFDALPTSANNRLPGSCNENCLCPSQNFRPLCGPDNYTTYFSPCFAGCPAQTPLKSSDGKNLYMDCNCVNGAATEGYCDAHCGNNFEIYVTMSTIAGIIGQLTRIGNTFVSLRIVAPSEKTFAVGFATALFSLFTWIPYPLVYGAVTNTACMVWEQKCGKTGNCLVYDTDKFRKRLLGMSIGLIFVGSVLDLAVVFLSSRIKHLYVEDEDIDTESDENSNNNKK